MESITQCPSEDSFVPLSEHQEQTPGSFFGGRPVLHQHCPASKLVTTADRLQLSSVLTGLLWERDSAVQVNGSAHTGSSEVVIIPELDVWVTSQSVLYAKLALSRSFDKIVCLNIILIDDAGTL